MAHGDTPARGQKGARSHPTPDMPAAARESGGSVDAQPRPVLRSQRGSLLVPVRVTPRAGRDALALEGGELRARLTAPPVEGAANEGLIALLAERLGVPRQRVTIARGLAARQKIVAIAGMDAATFWERIGL